MCSLNLSLLWPRLSKKTQTSELEMGSIQLKGMRQRTHTHTHTHTHSQAACPPPVRAWQLCRAAGFRQHRSVAECEACSMLGTGVKPHTRHTTPWNLSATVFFSLGIPKSNKMSQIWDGQIKPPESPAAPFATEYLCFFLMRVWLQVQVWFKHRRECAYVCLSKCSTLHPPRAPL